MPCKCETYTCVSVVPNYTDCLETIELDLEASDTGVYQWEYEFNGKWFGGTVNVVDGENIELPWVFNEFYVHAIRFLYNGALVGDTCYLLDTSSIAGSFATPSSTGAGNYLTFEAEVGDTQTNADIAGRTIILISDGAQIYNVSQFTQNGNTFVMTNGVSFYAGQVLTLIFA